jgi:hypothetical protein
MSDSLMENSIKNKIIWFLTSIDFNKIVKKSNIFVTIYPLTISCKNDIDLIKYTDKITVYEPVSRSLTKSHIQNIKDLTIIDSNIEEKNYLEFNTVNSLSLIMCDNITSNFFTNYKSDNLTYFNIDNSGLTDDDVEQLFINNKNIKHQIINTNCSKRRMPSSLMVVQKMFATLMFKRQTKLLGRMFATLMFVKNLFLKMFVKILIDIERLVLVISFFFLLLIYYI